MTDDDRGEIVFAIAQLRHAYAQLAANKVVNQREFAVGLLSPQIRRLERLTAQTPEKGSS